VGAKEYKPREYLYGEDERIITQLELEEVIRKITPKNVVMIQCVGSRNDERPYCSRVCCFHAVKNALLLKERNPATNIYILYRDIRTYGRREEYYREASEKGIIFLRYDEENPPEVKKEDGKIHVRISDPLLEREILLEPDLVVLSSAIVPGEDFPFLAQLLKVPLSRDGFFLEAHMKLRPVDFSADGIFLCGLAHSPKFIDECISQASAAAARACGVLSKEEIEAEGIVSFVNEEACAGCGICESTCPYGAIEIYEKVLSAPEIDARVDLKVRKAKVNEAICKGCGACTAACPSGAIQQHGFTDEQMLSVLSAV
jgi:heterodisulfide reductase subunit A